MTSRRKRPRWRWVLVLAVVILLVGIGACANYQKWMPRAIVYAPNTDKIVNPADDTGPAELAKLGVDRQLRIDVGPPAASLSLWILEPTNREKLTAGFPRGTIFVLHGIQDRKTSMLGWGKKLAAEGYRAVLVDSRGHGRSSGQWLTYGVVESRDLSQVLDALEKEGLITGRVGAFGASFGGSTLIQAARRDARIQAVVTVATFTSMREEVSHYIKHTPPGWLLSDRSIEEAIIEAGQLAGFDPKDASPLDSITKTKAQVLLIHGKADRKIPYQQSEALHAAAKDHSKIILVERENHDSIFLDRTGTITRESLAWFERWLVQP